jgi:hypothetical protein
MINGNLALRTLFLSNGIFVFAGIAVTPIYALYAEGMGASLLIVSYLASTLFLAKIIGTISLRIVGSKIHSKKLLLISGFLLRALGWIILIFAGSLVMLFIVQAILGIGEAIGSTSFRAMVATNLDEGQEISEYAEWEIILAFTGIAGTVAGGLIVTHFGFITLFPIIALLAIISALIALTFKTD